MDSVDNSTWSLWVYQHYEAGDTWLAAAPLIFLFVLLCFALYAFNCVIDTTMGAWSGAGKVVYIVTLPLRLPAQWAYQRLKSDI